MKSEKRDQEVFDKGVSVCVVDIPKEAANEICVALSAATGFRIDWHYVGGRVHIKALGHWIVRWTSNHFAVGAQERSFNTREAAENFGYCLWIPFKLVDPLGQEVTPT